MKSATFAVLAALGIVAAIVLLPCVVEHERVDRWFMPGELGTEKADEARQRGDGRTAGAALERSGRVTDAGHPPGGGMNKAESSEMVKRLSSEVVKRSVGQSTVSPSTASPSSASPSTGFLTRSVYAVRGDGAQEWLDRNRLMRRFNFSHNLNHIFPPSLHAEHPEFFPLENGVRLRPPEGSYFWNPDLGREDVAAWAANAARRFFDEHPEEVSFSVGVNDGLIFGESEETTALISGGKQKAESRKLKRKEHGQNPESGIQKSAEGIDTASPLCGFTASPKHADEGVRAPAESPRRSAADSGLSALDSQLSAPKRISYFRQRPDFTNLVYTFTNRVAADVARTHPDKYIGALAYYWCEDAPDFPLHPNVVPFLTADRSQGYDETFRLEERELQRRWVRAAGVGAAVKQSGGDAVSRPGGEAEEGETAGGSATASQGHGLTASPEKADEGVRAPTASLSHRLTASPTSAPPRRLGLYDYLYGSGFLIPRIHTQLIADNLRQAWRLGFTDYFAENHPNWGLDGPMPWLVAQLLQDPEQSREVLLEEYYTRYFGAAAVPMRRFFERCERQWMSQPGPAYWLKHYRNESQARLFPSGICRELRGLLDEAERQARDSRTRARVALVSDAFGVTERFVAFCEARERLNRKMLKAESRKRKAQSGIADHTDERGSDHSVPSTRFVAGLGSDPSRSAACRDAFDRYRCAREEFERYTKALMERSPLAIAPFTWEDYLRHEPPVDGGTVTPSGGSSFAEATEDREAVSGAMRKAQCREQKADGARQRGDGLTAGAALERSGSVTRAGHPPGVGRRKAESSEALTRLSGEAAYRPVSLFHDLTGVPLKPARRIAGIEYGIALPEGWQCYVEPSEHHAATLENGVLRLTGNKETMVYQWIRLDSSDAHRATVAVRARVSPATNVSLTMSWLDADQKRLGYRTHRLPEGDWPDWVTLDVAEATPAGAVWIGVGFRVQNQVAGDWAEARSLRLEQSQTVNGEAVGR